MDSKILYIINIKGRVQGVGFRWHTAVEARGLGITGFVRNQSDGSVYVEAEGFREKLEIFLNWCRSGPVYSTVESVEKEEAPPLNYADFRIIH